MSVSAVARYAALPAPYIPAKAAGPKAAQYQNGDDKGPLPVQPVKAVTRQTEGLRLRDPADEERQRGTKSRTAGANGSLETRGLVLEAEVTARPSTAFLVQVLGQGSRPQPGIGLAGYGQDIGQHRDAAALTSALYRQAGAEPGLLSDHATLLSLAV